MPGKSGLLHAEADRLRRCDCGNFHGAAFIVLDQENEEFQLIILFRAGLGIGNHALPEALQHRGMVIGVLDQFHSRDWVRGSGKRLYIDFMNGPSARGTRLTAV